MIGGDLFMDLKDFVKQTIAQLSQAIVDSNSDLKPLGTIVNPANVVIQPDKKFPFYGELVPDQKELRIVHLIEFDVAITTSESKEKGGDISIKVASIGIGGEGKKQSEYDVNSHISFKLPVALPVGKEKN
jgi:hypothetical protein